MSHRSIVRDPIHARKCQYQKLEQAGEQQEAIMEAFALLSEQGFNLGGKMAAILAKRSEIKQRNQK